MTFWSPWKRIRHGLRRCPSTVTIPELKRRPIRCALVDDGHRDHVGAVITGLLGRVQAVCW